jgi:phosphoribosylformimino-5-aminoimidazole carboxamide ribotide isomerase
MIDIIPSLTVFDKKCVRLPKGDFAKMTVYEKTPYEVAKSFEDHGLTKVHFVDLAASQTGKVSLDSLQLIAGYTNLSIDYGGGIKTNSDIRRIFSNGADAVTIGTLAYHNPELVYSWLISYGSEKITMAADTIEGKLVVSGRLETTEADIYEHIENFINNGMVVLKCSDLSRDGILSGPNFELYDNLHKRYPTAKIYASGGISSVDDFKRLEDMGIPGVIVGSAIYEGRVSLKDIENYLSHQNLN